MSGSGGLGPCQQVTLETDTCGGTRNNAFQLEYNNDQHIEQLFRTLDLDPPAPSAEDKGSQSSGFDLSLHSPDVYAVSLPLPPRLVSDNLRFPESRLQLACETGPGTHAFFASPSSEYTSPSHQPLAASSSPFYPTTTQSSNLTTALYGTSYPPRTHTSANSVQYRGLSTPNAFCSYRGFYYPDNHTPSTHFASGGLQSLLECEIDRRVHPLRHAIVQGQNPQGFGYGRALAGGTGHLLFEPSIEPLNFLSLLHSSASLPYHCLVARIINFSDRQSSIFLQQRLKVVDSEERAKIIDAVCHRGFELMVHRFGNWAVQRCLDTAFTVEDRNQVVSCMRGRVIELATNCYGARVLQRALDCEESICRLIVFELLEGNPLQSIVNRHALHVWNKCVSSGAYLGTKLTALSSVSKSFQGRWARVACLEYGSLLVQLAFENLEITVTNNIVKELLDNGFTAFAEVVKSRWGSYCIRHILENGSDRHKCMALKYILEGLLEFGIHCEGSKTVMKAVSAGGAQIVDLVVHRMCDSADGARRPIIVDLALSIYGSRLITSVLTFVDEGQRRFLYERIKGYIVTLRHCKSGSIIVRKFCFM
ncbi:hypothetical protein CVT26_006375 [Gymnopilus dilepis]|uniref:PUM-HD domain-containing protein n=1 Tax=Gymnopilus dilepis TaxID=231916 RepID=A0A409Y0M5_9AGAR|nr:hypothetical protein CVT26_006375 [Gymnopilus dilepis]